MDRKRKRNKHVHRVVMISDIGHNIYSLMIHLPSPPFQEVSYLHPSSFRDESYATPPPPFLGGTLSLHTSTFREVFYFPLPSPFGEVSYLSSPPTTFKVCIVSLYPLLLERYYIYPSIPSPFGEVSYLSIPPITFKVCIVSLHPLLLERYYISPSLPSPFRKVYYFFTLLFLGKFTYFFTPPSTFRKVYDLSTSLFREVSYFSTPSLHLQESI